MWRAVWLGAVGLYTVIVMTIAILTWAAGLWPAYSFLGLGCLAVAGSVALFMRETNT